MIRIDQVSKSFRCTRGRKRILHNVSHVFEQGECVALLGRNGEGKSSLLKMLTGILRPDSGVITAEGSVSWPVAFAGGLHGDLTGVQNIRFVARVYGRDSDDMIRYCREMSALHDYLEMPVHSYSSGMRARLAFSMSMAVPFDYYLIDEITSVGDLEFREKSEQILAARLEETGGIIVSHALPSLRRLCHSGLVLEDGVLTHHSNLENAIQHHQRLKVNA